MVVKSIASFCNVSEGVVRKSPMRNAAPAPLENINSDQRTFIAALFAPALAFAGFGVAVVGLRAIRRSYTVSSR